jgi:hypothetical protein
MKIKLTILLVLVVFLTNFAQDTIIKKDGETLKVTIKEVNKNNIKYVDYNDKDGVLFTIDKALVQEVKFTNGKDLDVKNPEKNSFYFADDKINNYMFNFSAFSGNTLSLAYERVLKPGQSVMAEAKVYGIGIKKDFEKNRSGFGLDLHYRLKAKSLFSPNKFKPKHILHGGYFAPVIGFSTGEIIYNENHSFFGPNFEDGDKLEHTVFHFGIQYGKQWILQDKYSIDISIGYHVYSGEDNDLNVDDDSYNDDNLRLGNMIGSDNQLFSFNLRLGFLGGKETIIKKP